MSDIEALLTARKLDLLGLLRAVHTLNDKEQIAVQYKPLLRQKWFTLQEEPQELSGGKLQQWKRNRGFEFERILFALFALERLQPVPSFRTKSEQVDGLFECHERYFLVEAKWEKEPLPASAVYSFRGKLEGRLIGTLGTLIAVNGFSDNVSDALMYGGAMNVILFNGSDIDYALQADYSFKQLLDIKLRQAARMREAFYTFARFLDEERA
jgi:hypothetical protein